jgi:hypothetical protein
MLLLTHRETIGRSMAMNVFLRGVNIAKAEHEHIDDIEKRKTSFISKQTSRMS